MLLKNKKLNIVLISASMLFALSLKTNTVEAKLFNIYLYFDSEKNLILSDRDANSKLILSDEEYDFSSLEEQVPGDYYFRTSNFNSDPIDPIYFTPAKGKFILKVPYYPAISEVSVYYKDSILADFDLSIFAACNNNGVCEAPKGENSQNCIVDCFRDDMDNKLGVIKEKKDFPLGNIKAPKEDSSPITGSDSKTKTESEAKADFPYLGLFSGLLLMLIGIGFGAYKFWKSKREE